MLQDSASSTATTSSRPGEAAAGVIRLLRSRRIEVRAGVWSKFSLGIVDFPYSARLILTDRPTLVLLCYSTPSSCL